MSAVLASGADAQSTPTAPADAYRAVVRTFGEMSAMLSGAEDLDDALHFVARGAGELLRIRRCSIYLRERDADIFHGRVIHDACTPHQDRTVFDARIKRVIAGTAADRFTDEILTTRAPVYTANAQEDRRLVRATMRAWDVRAILGVPMILKSKVIGLMFLDDGDAVRRFSPTELEVVMAFANLAAIATAQANATFELRRSMHTVSHQNQLLRRATQMDERLTALALEGAGLHDIAAAVAELTTKPCHIVDCSFRRLATVMPGWAVDGAPHFDPHVLTLADPARALDTLEAEGGGLIGPFPGVGINQRCIVTQIGTHSDPWGWLVLTEHGSRFGPLDLHIARRAATNAAFHLAAERRAARAEFDARATLAAELVRGPADLAATNRRAEYLAVDLDTPHVVCVIAQQPEDAPHAPSALDVLALCSEAGIDAPLAGAVEAGTLLVLPLDPSLHPRQAVAQISRRIHAALALTPLGDRLVAAVSTRCHKIADYPRAYAEVRQVLRCVHELAADSAGLVLSADDLGPGRLFLASTDRGDADRFAQDALGDLLDADPEISGYLLETLQAFFECARSVRRTASALGMHENTIRNRLNKIEELTRLEVASNSDDQLTAHLALLILRLRGGLARPALAVG